MTKLNTFPPPPVTEQAQPAAPPANAARLDPSAMPRHGSIELLGSSGFAWKPNDPKTFGVTDAFAFVFEVDEMLVRASVRIVLQDIELLRKSPRENSGPAPEILRAAAAAR